MPIVWRAGRQIMKKVLVKKNRSLGRPRTRWVDIMAQEIKNIKEVSMFDDKSYYDRVKWRNFVIAAMALNGLIS